MGVGFRSILIESPQYALILLVAANWNALGALVHSIVLPTKLEHAPTVTAGVDEHSFTTDGWSGRRTSPQGELLSLGRRTGSHPVSTLLTSHVSQFSRGSTTGRPTAGWSQSSVQLLPRLNDRSEAHHCHTHRTDNAGGFRRPAKVERLRRPETCNPQGESKRPD